MSRFSGKADLWDHIFISAESEQEAFEKFKGTKLYKQKKPEDCVEINDLSEACKNWDEIKYDSIADLVPYYPYVISMAFCDNKDSSNSTVVLMSESWVDVEEKRSLELYLDQIAKEYNKSKREKREFNKEDVFRKVRWMNHNADAIRELIDRFSKIDENNRTVTFEGIHLKMSDYYRNELQDELKRVKENV